MFLQAQRAFGVSPERHYRFLHAAVEENPRIIVLNVLVQAADNLEAKDANGKQLNGEIIEANVTNMLIFSTEIIASLWLDATKKRSTNETFCSQFP